MVTKPKTWATTSRSSRGGLGAQQRSAVKVKATAARSRVLRLERYVVPKVVLFREGLIGKQVVEVVEEVGKQRVWTDAVKRCWSKERQKGRAVKVNSEVT